MQYLVQLRLVPLSRPTTADEGLAFIEQYILPTLERCEQLQTLQKIAAGGPVSGAVALDLIINAETAQQLDEVITALPAWPLMETTVTPLTTFTDRRQAVLAMRERLAKATREGAGAVR
jgi:muconolactone delta-isomerase